MGMALGGYPQFHSFQRHFQQGQDWDEESEALNSAAELKGTPKKAQQYK